MHFCVPLIVIVFSFKSQCRFVFIKNDNKKYIVKYA